jgi:hypothetical protein
LLYKNAETSSGHNFLETSPILLCNMFLEPLWKTLDRG